MCACVYVCTCLYVCVPVCVYKWYMYVCPCMCVRVYHKAQNFDGGNFDIFDAFLLDRQYLTRQFV